jgi:hypothetical protein
VCVCVRACFRAHMVRMVVCVCASALLSAPRLRVDSEKPPRACAHNRHAHARAHAPARVCVRVYARRARRPTQTAAAAAAASAPSSSSVSSRSPPDPPGRPRPPAGRPTRHRPTSRSHPAHLAPVRLRRGPARSGSTRRFFPGPTPSVRRRAGRVRARVSLRPTRTAPTRTWARRAPRQLQRCRALRRWSRRVSLGNLNSESRRRRADPAVFRVGPGPGHGERQVHSDIIRSESES